MWSIGNNVTHKDKGGNCTSYLSLGGQDVIIDTHWLQVMIYLIFYLYAVNRLSARSVPFLGNPF